jgi:hypothetical protein
MTKADRKKNEQRNATGMTHLLRRRRPAAATSDNERGITIIRAASAGIGSMVVTNADALPGAYNFEMPLTMNTTARRMRAMKDAFLLIFKRLRLFSLVSSGAAACCIMLPFAFGPSTMGADFAQAVYENLRGIARK